MYRKILVGIDGRDHGRDALALGDLLAARTGADLIGAHVYPFTGPFPSQYAWLDTPPQYAWWGSETRELATQTLDEAIADVGVDVERIRQTTLGGTSPARGLHDLAEAEEVDLIVVCSSHRGSAGRALAGTVGLTLLHGSPCGVAMAPAGFRQQADTALRVIGVGYDGQPESEVALDGAIDLARSVGAALHIIAVVCAPAIGYQGKGLRHAGAAELEEAIAEHMQGVLDRALERIPDGVEASGELVRGTSETLGDQEGIDLMVVGSRGYGPLRRVLLGSVSSHLVRSASYPLMVLPRGSSRPVEAPVEPAGGSAGATPATSLTDGAAPSLAGAGSRPAPTYWPL